MEKRIKNYDAILNRQSLWDCHIDTLNDYFFLNGVNIDKGILYILTERLVPEFAYFYLKGIRLGMLGKAPYDIIENFLNKLQIKYKVKNFGTDDNIKTLLKYIDEGKIPLILYDNTILSGDQIAKKDMIYLRHFSSGLVISYNDENEYFTISRRAMATNEFKRFSYDIIGKAMNSKMMPIAPRGKYLVLEYLSEEECERIKEYIESYALSSLKNGLKNYSECMNADIEKITQNVELYSDDLLKTVNLKIGDFYAGEEAYDQTIEYLKDLKMTISDKSAKAESRNKLFYFKASVLNIELKVSPTFYFVDLYDGLKAIFENLNYNENKKNEILQSVDAAARAARSFTRTLHGFDRVLFKEKFLSKLIDNVNAVNDKNKILNAKLNDMLVELGV